MFIVKTTDGNSYKITDDEMKQIPTAGQLIFFRSCGITINKSCISSIYPEHKSDEVENRKQQQTGVLHDGTRVIRKFGEWVIAGEQTIDDNGTYQPIKLNRVYYPEIASDCVASEQEYKQVMAGKDYYQLVGYTPRQNKELKGEFTPINKILI